MTLFIDYLTVLARFYVSHFIFSISNLIIGDKEKMKEKITEKMKGGER